MCLCAVSVQRLSVGLSCLDFQTIGCVAAAGFVHGAEKERVQGGKIRVCIPSAVSTGYSN